MSPRTIVESILVDIWSELLEAEPIGVTDDFFDVGGHSLLAVRLMAEIETRFGVRLPLETLFTKPTVERLAWAIQSRSPSNGSSLVTIREGNGATPLFCVHAAGGTVFSYVELARRLDPHQPVYGLQALPAAGGAASEESIPAMAARYLGHIRTVQPEGPYALSGWSMGGLVAFELAQQLIAAGESVSFLGLIDTTSRTAALSVDGDDGLDDDVGDDPLLRLGRLFESNVRAAGRYRPFHYPGRIALFRPRDAAGESDCDLGWGELAHDVDLVFVPGTHFTMVREPHVSELAAELERQLRDALGNGG